MPSKNPRVFLDVSIGTRTGGRIVIELFTDLTPRTAENFRGICTGEYGLGKRTKKALTYQGCSVFRSVKGQYIQSGDFQFNNGDGGESIFGGTFADESMMRRHTQAGVLSMANNGRNTNGSQFFITLKRAPLLDGKNVAFGQVVDGMDVVRAISQVPVDKDDKPRVPIHIVSCGEEGKAKTAKGDDIHKQFAEQIAELTEEAAPTKVRESAKGKEILAGKQGGAPDTGGAAALRSHAQGTADEDDLEDGAAPKPPKNDRERRLQELRMKMNQSRMKNSKEVVEEQKRHADPEYARRQAERKFKEEQQEGKDSEGKAPKKGVLPEGKEHLGDTIEHCEMKDGKKKRKNPDAFGWDVFNQDSLARAHEKRLKHVQFDEDAYNQQKESGEGSSLFSGFGYQASEEQKDRLAEALDKMGDKKKNFSRRRMHVTDEDCNYVNERNRHFNKKMERFFGEYTHETRQNLERGTAL